MILNPRSIEDRIVSATLGSTASSNISATANAIPTPSIVVTAPDLQSANQSFRDPKTVSLSGSSKIISPVSPQWETKLELATSTSISALTNEAGDRIVRSGANDVGGDGDNPQEKAIGVE